MKREKSKKKQARTPHAPREEGAVKPISTEQMDLCEARFLSVSGRWMTRVWGNLHRDFRKLTDVAYSQVGGECLQTFGKILQILTKAIRLKLKILGSSFRSTIMYKDRSPVIANAVRDIERLAPKALPRFEVLILKCQSALCWLDVKCPGASLEVKGRIETLRAAEDAAQSAIMKVMIIKYDSYGLIHHSVNFNMSIAESVAITGSLDHYAEKASELSYYVRRLLPVVSESESSGDEDVKKKNVTSEISSDRPLIPKTVMPPEVLPERLVKCLDALFKLKAKNATQRKTAQQVAQYIYGNRLADADTVKESMAELTRLNYVKSKVGRGGGSWLTPEGISRQRLEKKSRGK